MPSSRFAGRRAAVLGLLVLAGVGLGGCGGLLERSYPEKSQFVLEARRPDAPPAPRIGKSLVLRPFRASPRLDGVKFVYRTGDERYESDFYHVFWTPPDALLGDQTRTWLAASGLFESVWDVRSVVPPALMLEGSVVDLYADYRSAGPPVAVLALGFALVDVERVPPGVAFDAQYRAEVPAATDTPEALVAAWNAALADVLTRFESDLATRGLH